MNRRQNDDERPGFRLIVLPWPLAVLFFPVWLVLRYTPYFRTPMIVRVAAVVILVMFAIAFLYISFNE